MQRALIPLLAGLLFTSGCAYRLIMSVPRQEKLRIIVPSPNAPYLIRTEGPNWHGREYKPDAEGRVTMEILDFHGCDVYFLNVIKVRNPPKLDKEVVILKDGKVIRKIALNKVGKLPQDEMSYHVLKIR
jgi:hypothetical protein